MSPSLRWSGPSAYYNCPTLAQVYLKISLASAAGIREFTIRVAMKRHAL